MNIIDNIGILAALLTTGCTLPQIYHLWKTKNVSSISLESYVIMLVGICLWLIYAFSSFNVPLIFSNIYSFLASSTILYLRLKYYKR